MHLVHLLPPSSLSWPTRHRGVVVVVVAIVVTLMVGGGGGGGGRLIGVGAVFVCFGSRGLAQAAVGTSPY